MVLKDNRQRIKPVDIANCQDASLSANVDAQLKPEDIIVHPFKLDWGNGNEYPLDEMMSELTSAIFDADGQTSVNAFRRNLQSEYVDRLGAMIVGSGSGAFDTSAQAIALYELEKVRAMQDQRNDADTFTRAHARFLSAKIEGLLASLKNA